MWSNSDGGSWGDANNWSAGVPIISSAVVINNGNTKTVRIDASTPSENLAARRLTISGPIGTTNTLALSNIGASSFRLANTLSLESGGVIDVAGSTFSMDGALGGSFNILAGELRLATGEVSAVNGAVMRIGRVGQGLALINAGTLVADSDCAVGGLAGSDGTLTLLEGAVTIAGQLTIGDDPGSVGRVNVSGGTFISTNVLTRLGDDGTGELTMSGGIVKFADVSVGRGTGSIGQMSIRGGTMQADSISAGRFAGSKGTVEISGGTVKASIVYVGREGNGTLRLLDGVVNFDTLLVASADTSVGFFEQGGGTLTATNLISTNTAAKIVFGAGWLEVSSTTLSNGAPLVIGDGVHAATLHLKGGTNVFASGLLVSSNATLSGSGTIIGNITVSPGGTNLLNQAPSELVRLTPAWVSMHFRLSFPSALGKSYDIEMSPGLSPGSWLLLTTRPGTGAEITFDDNTSEPGRFYRVRVRP